MCLANGNKENYYLLLGTQWHSKVSKVALQAYSAAFAYHTPGTLEESPRIGSHDLEERPLHFESDVLYYHPVRLS